jgi:hypothetical protein
MFFSSTPYKQFMKKYLFFDKNGIKKRGVQILSARRSFALFWG